MSSLMLEGKLLGTIRQLIASNGLTKEVYVNWLSQTYFFVRHSTRLLAFSAGLSPFELQQHHERALTHALEEKNHERLIEADLKHLGYTIQNFNEFTSTRSFYQCQYYQIQHVHPISFLGYVYFLETLSIEIGKELLDPVSKNWGDKASNFLRVHAQEDVEHVAELGRLLEKFDLKLQTIVKQNWQQSSDLYGVIVGQIFGR